MTEEGEREGNDAPGYLERDAAEALLREPCEGFPDIYPEGGVEWLLDETNCHPYLLQLVADQLVRRLNEQRRFKATADDLEWAVDEAFTKTTLFDDLWRQQRPNEQAALRALARNPEEPVTEHRAALRDLVRYQFVVREAERHRIAVPLFASWIRDHQLDGE